MSAFDAFGGGLSGDVPAQGDLDRAVADARSAFALARARRALAPTVATP